MSNVTFYNQAQHSTFLDAKHNGALYQTGSSLDMFSNRSVFYDTLEVIDELTKCVGTGADIVAGVERQDGTFVTLERIRIKFDEAICYISEVDIEGI